MTPIRLLPRRQALLGLTLVELLVAITIGLVLTLAVTGIVVVSESHRRSMIAVADADQSGAYAASVLDLALRSAGSGFVQAADQGAFGCQLSATGELPRAKAFPAPFANSFLAGKTSSLRLAPVLIAKNQSDAGSDVLVVMRGNGAAGDVPRRITSAGDATTLKLDEGLSWAMGGDSGRTRTETEIHMWKVARGAAGRLPPNGFPRDNKF